MCSFLTLALVSTGVQAFGAYKQGQATAAAAEYNAKVADMNAEILDKAAKDELERGAREEQRKRAEVAQIKSRQMAAMSANGLDIGFGSPLDTIIDTAYAGEMDALTIRTNANRAEYNKRVDAANTRAQATIYRSEASSARTGGMLNALGVGLSGASQAFGKYAELYPDRKNPLFSN